MQNVKQTVSQWDWPAIAGVGFCLVYTGFVALYIAWVEGW